MARRPENPRRRDAPRRQDQHATAGLRQANSGGSPIADIAQMGADIDPRRMNEIHVGAAAALLARHVSLINLFGDEPIRDFMEEFLENQSNSRRTSAREAGSSGKSRCRPKARPARLVEIFGDRPWAREDHADSSTRTGVCPAGSRIEKSRLRSKGFSSMSSGLMAYSREGGRTKRECGHRG